MQRQLFYTLYTEILFPCIGITTQKLQIQQLQEVLYPTSLRRIPLDTLNAKPISPKRNTIEVPP